MTCNIQWERVITASLCLLKNGPFPATFSLFLSFKYTVDSKQMFNINQFLPMTGFEPRTPGIGSNRSTNWATTTALVMFVYDVHFLTSGERAAATIKKLFILINNLCRCTSGTKTAKHFRPYKLWHDFDAYFVVLNKFPQAPVWPDD